VYNSWGNVQRVLLGVWGTCVVCDTPVTRHVAILCRQIAAPYGRFDRVSGRSSPGGAACAGPRWLHSGRLGTVEAWPSSGWRTTPLRLLDVRASGTTTSPLPVGSSPRQRWPQGFWTITASRVLRLGALTWPAQSTPPASHSACASRGTFGAGRSACLRPRRDRLGCRCSLYAPGEELAQ